MGLFSILHGSKTISPRGIKGKIFQQYRIPKSSCQSMKINDVSLVQVIYYIFFYHEMYSCFLYLFQIVIIGHSKIILQIDLEFSIMENV